MNIPKRAIEKAIEGGWQTFLAQGFTWNSKGVTDADGDFTSYAEIAFYPEFWQALGKSCGWKGGTDCPICGADGGSRASHGWGGEWYRYHALNFYDLILTGGDVQAFWDSLLPNPQP